MKPHDSQRLERGLSVLHSGWNGPPPSPAPAGPAGADAYEPRTARISGASYTLFRRLPVVSTTTPSASSASIAS